MKLNNKGMTTVEVLICFILVAVIMMSLYSTISAFNNKRLEENYRSKIIMYKDILTQKIQDDFIKVGLTYANISEERLGEGGRKYTVNCTLRDGSQRRLVVSQRFTKTDDHPDGTISMDDEFIIEYGPLSKIEEYPLPELGETYWKTIEKEDPSQPGTNITVTERNDTKTGSKVAKDLQINNVLINISNENTTDGNESHVLNIYIGFYHPDLGNKYAINIVSPINYNASSTGQVNKFNFPITG